MLDEVALNPGEEEAGFHSRLFERVEALNREALLIALGGEHSITPEMVFARMPEGGTVVQIDAHADLRPEYRGSIYGTLVEEDFVQTATFRGWSQVRCVEAGV